MTMENNEKLDTDTLIKERNDARRLAITLWDLIQDSADRGDLRFEETKPGSLKAMRILIESWRGC